MRRDLLVPALAAAAGLLLSGPISLTLIHQPPWVDTATFLVRYERVQSLPFVFGFILLAALLVLVLRAAGHLPERARTRRAAATLCAGVFAAWVGLNYAIQTMFVPAAVAAGDRTVSAFTMQNPRSLAWMLEMVGYAWLGVATWLVAPAFQGAGRRAWIRALLVANGAVSVAAAAGAAGSMEWLFRPSGLIAYGAWNLLLLVALVLVAVDAAEA
jgi:hypothetical protein